MVIDEWIVVRRGWLTKGFLDALTLGGPGGAPRPIELKAHDPLRYVGDMLAWVHQALPSEREAAQMLFSKCVDLGKSNLFLKVHLGLFLLVFFAPFAGGI